MEYGCLGEGFFFKCKKRRWGYRDKERSKCEGV